MKFARLTVFARLPAPIPFSNSSYTCASSTFEVDNV